MPPKRVARGRTRLPFVVYKEMYTNRCFVDKEILNEHGAGVLKASFQNKNQKEVVVHVLTAEFFGLHHLSKENLELWEHMNLQGFFELPAWGPDYMRAYQALTTLDQDNHFKVTSMDGAQLQIHLTRRLVREALNLPFGESINFFKIKHLDEDNKVCSNSGKPIWDELNH